MLIVLCVCFCQLVMFVFANQMFPRLIMYAALILDIDLTLMMKMMMVISNQILQTRRQIWYRSICRHWQKLSLWKPYCVLYLRLLCNESFWCRENVNMSYIFLWYLTAKMCLHLCLFLWWFCLFLFLFHIELKISYYHVADWLLMIDQRLTVMDWQLSLIPTDTCTQ